MEKALVRRIIFFYYVVFTELFWMEFIDILFVLNMDIGDMNGI